MSDQPLKDKDAADTPDSKDSFDEIEDAAGMDNDSIDSLVARSLGADLQILADNFWYDLPAQIKNIDLRDDELALRVELPFRNPVPSDEKGDWLSSQEDIDGFRMGFVNFLREQPQVRRRLANFFYSEFHRFLMVQTKRSRFGDAIRAKIERSGERRLAGRPKLPIPDRAKKAVKAEGSAIYRAVLEMQAKIKCWKKEADNISEKQVLERLKTEYDREQFPWSRYAFQNTRSLPAKRAYGSRKAEVQKGQLTRPGLAEPEGWSAPDIAALWTQIWFYREHGEQYDLREIRKLLKPPKTS